MGKWYFRPLLIETFLDILAFWAQLYRKPNNTEPVVI